MRCTENQQKKTGVLVGIAKKSYDLVKIVNEFSLHTVVHIKRKNSRRYFFFLVIGREIIFLRDFQIHNALHKARGTIDFSQLVRIIIFQF